MRFTLPLRKIYDQIGELTKKHSNLPERYLKRVVDKLEYQSPNLPNYVPKKIYGRQKARFTMHRPWTEQFKSELQERRDVFETVQVEPIKEWTVFVGDRVQVLAGKDAGKQGIVTQLVQERNWCIVQGLNWKIHRQGKTKTFPGIVTKEEQPLLVTTEVKLLDPSDEKPTEVEWRYTEEGDRVRVSKRTGRIIPVPRAAEATIDYKEPQTYSEHDKKDTKSDDVQEITFQPKLMTFEMEVMEELGIQEDRVPKKSYWY